ncbi:DgyrCDS5508 [Dimorphilus gyrociliatus]|uniref:DgyrCDS5508 n=1 Tax=Dimorphilus gyrociliatus TaxID=2664684 RepID=A0A7I8VK34_9ANNE|nr:DgyrCDS5508 [Dimorphilus gyrociliatus]
MRLQLAITLFFAAAVPFVFCGSAKVGEDCSSKSDCIDNANCIKANDACSKGTCQCATGYATNAKDCAKVVGFDEACAADKPCDPMKYLKTCGASKKCECGDGYKADNKVCKSLKTKKFGEACDASNLCISPYVCTASKCACSNSKYTNDKCKGVMHKAACEAGVAGKECHLAYKLKCTSKVCECETNYVWGPYVDAAGVSTDMCVHKDATKNVKAGETCVVSNDDKGKLCVADHSCQTCKGDSDAKCRKNPETTTESHGSASSIAINGLLVFGVALLKKLL